MKTFISLAGLLPLIGTMLLAQVPSQPPPPMSPDAINVAPAPVPFSPEQLEQLLGPIALYPDALVALILPASTNPSDLGMAASYLSAGGDPAQADAQPWDDSVRALAHYPEVVRWMDQNIAWTQQLGQAFTYQSADVMNAIQRLRARARAAGTLVDTPQQQVVYEAGTIMIVPAQPDVIYVPYYDPAIVYAPPPWYAGYPPSAFFNYSPGFVAGWWLSFGFDWGHRSVWTVHREERERYWHEHRDPRDRWHASPGHFAPPAEAHVWRPRFDDHDRQRRFAPARPGQPPSRGIETRHDEHRPDSYRGNEGQFSRRTPQPTGNNAGTEPPPVNSGRFGRQPTDSGVRGGPAPQPAPTVQSVPPAQPSNNVPPPMNSGRFGRRPTDSGLRGPAPQPAPSVQSVPTPPPAVSTHPVPEAHGRRFDRPAFNDAPHSVSPAPMPSRPMPTPAAPPPASGMQQAHALSPQYGSVGMPMPRAYSPPPAPRAAPAMPHVAPAPPPPPPAGAPQSNPPPQSGDSDTRHGPVRQR